MAKARKQTPSAQSFSQIDTVLRSIRKSWPLIVASFLVSTAVALLYSKSLPRIYLATALLQFDPNPPRPLSKEASPFHEWTSYFDNQEILQTQFKIVLSESNLSSVARDLSLMTDPKFGGSSSSPVP